MEPNAQQVMMAPEPPMAEAEDRLALVPLLNEVLEREERLRSARALVLGPIVGAVCWLVLGALVYALIWLLG